MVDDGIPVGFLFSQGNLQDFVDCKRRFKLKYLHKLDWPGILSEPVSELEQSLLKGSRLHTMIHQHLLGNPEDRIEAMAQGSDLVEWWHNYLNFYHGQLQNQSKHYPEAVFLGKLAGHRLIARYDLILYQDNRINIYDWKSSRFRPKRQDLQRRLQTMVYPYLAANVGAEFLGASIPAENIRMIYWFVQHPTKVEIFEYSQDQYQQDESRLKDLVETILLTGPDNFHKTDDLGHCQYCVYRSFCDRGIGAGQFTGQSDSTWMDEDEIGEFSLDFESITEIEA